MKPTAEDQVLAYFHEAPLAAAQAMLNVVHSVVARRQPTNKNTETVAKPGGISAATRKKISATLKAKNEAKRLQQAASTAAALKGNGKDPEAPASSRGGTSRKGAASQPLAITMSD